jgi:hypothetical protein
MDSMFCFLISEKIDDSQKKSVVFGSDSQLGNIFLKALGYLKRSANCKG